MEHMAASILYRSAKWSTAEAFRLHDLHKGSQKNDEQKNAAIVWKINVGARAISYNPIGRDDTRRASVWVLYRNGIYGAKIVQFWHNFNQIWHKYGQIWRNFVKKLCFFDFLNIFMTSFRRKCYFLEKKKAPAGMRTRKKKVVDTKMTKIQNWQKKYST